MIPYVVDISGKLTAEEAFLRLAPRPGCVFLDSARRNSPRGRYSFVAAEPFAQLQDDGREDSLAELDDQLQCFATLTLEGLPPFQGGAAGLWSYDLSKQLERIAVSRFNEFPLPRLAVGLYDVVVAFDHRTDRGWIVSQGFPETEPQRRQVRARERAEACLRWLDTPVAPPRTSLSPTRSADDLAPSFPMDRPGTLSNFSPQEYKRAIQRAIDYVHAGDVFQINLAQRLLCPASTDSVSLYRQLRRLNPAPFAAYLDLGESQILSASPERFLQVRDGNVEARPIKGTRQRTTRPEADLFSAAELSTSSKDLAENVMIVDLMRNDLSLVCEDDSIQVTQLCSLEIYAYVQHLVSVVRGRLREQVSAVDVIRAAFPGGSITGAPKVRAMEIIAELEPTARNAYCGSLGYVGFDGTMDLSILIRTITASRGWWQFPVGGGIVAQSDPEQEYLETLVKAEGMLRAIAACHPESIVEPHR